MKEPYSHFLFFISQRIGAIWKKFHKSGVPSAEQFIAAQNLNYEPFARSVKMTDVVYKKMKALLGPNIKLLVFDADSFNPQYDQFVRLSAENNIPFAAGLDAFVRQAEVAGECTRSEDGYHWNDRGNELVATFLKKEVERRLQEK
jgi:hypothetical protein